VTAPLLAARDPGLDPGRVPVLDPDPPLAPTRGRRLPLRLAWRDAARHPWRTALGILMVGLPVFVALTAVIVLRTDQISEREAAPLAMGRSDGLAVDENEPGSDFWLSAAGFRYGVPPDVGVPEEDAPPPRSRAEMARTLDSPVTPVSRGAVTVGEADAARFAWAAEVDLTDPLTDGMAIVESGRVPATTGEVALSPELAARLGLAVGDTVTIGDRSFRTTGVVTVPVALGDTQGLQVVGMPRDLPVSGQRSTAYLVEQVPDLDDPVLDTPSYRNLDEATGDDPLDRLRAWADDLLVRDGIGLTPRDLLTRGEAGVAEQAGVAGWQYGLTLWLLPVYVLVVLQLAVMAAPSLAVGVRQNRRMFALLQGAGADGRTLRRTVLAQAALVGLVGSVGAVVLAVAVTGTVAAVGWWPAALGPPGPYEVRAGEVLLAVAAGTGACVLAGLLPAREAARSAPVGSLAGRAPRPHLPWRRAGWGAALVAGAVLLLWVAGSGSAWMSVAPFTVLALVVGMLLLVPLTVHGLGRVAPGFPLSGRLALRDATRASGRSVAAIATVAIAVAGAVAAAMTSASLQEFDRAQYVPRWPAGTAVVETGVMPDDLRGAEADSRIAALVAEISATVPGTEAFEVANADFSTTVTVADDTVEPVVAGPDALRELGYRVDGEVAAALRDGAGILLAPDVASVSTGDIAEVRVESVGLDGVPGLGTSDLRVVRLPVARDVRELLVSPGTAADLGIPTQVSQLVLAVDGPVTTAQEAALDRAVREVTASGFAGVYVERGYRGSPGLRTAVALLVLAAALVVVLGTATATALALIDTRRDRDLLAAAGASPRTGRGVAAATTLAYSGAGAVLGTTIGLLLGLVFALRTIPGERGARPSADPVVVLPWLEMGLLVVGLPVLLAGLAWLATRGGSALAGAREASRV
jgi:putative ABC transport system permease protein